MSPGTPSRRERAFAGVAALVVAVAIAIGVRAGPGNAPTWVGDAAAFAFALAGVSVLAGLSASPRVEWVASIASALALLAVGLWVVLGPGDRACTLSIAPFTGAVGNTACRGIFGAGSLILLLLIVLLAARRPEDRHD